MNPTSVCSFNLGILSNQKIKETKVLLIIKFCFAFKVETIYIKDNVITSNSSDAVFVFLCSCNHSLLHAEMERIIKYYTKVICGTVIVLNVSATIPVGHHQATEP